MTVFWRIAWVAFMLGAAAVAGLWWWLMPSGFPWHHPRLWSNQIVPGFVVLFSLWVVGRITTHPTTASNLLGFLPSVAIGLAVSFRCAFPISSETLWLVPLSLGLLLSAAAYLAAREWVGSRWTLGTGCLLGLLIGAGLPLSQRGPEPTTRPERTEQIAPAVGNKASLRMKTLGEGIALQPDVGRIRVRHGSVSVDVYPLLTFESRSSDRCWVLFESLGGRFEPGLVVKDGVVGTEGLWYRYKGLERATLKVSRSGASLAIDAEAILDEAVYSHLNTYTGISVGGHSRLHLGFSPIQGIRFEALPADYPDGRPLRFAYLGDDGTFRVVQARSGEKGPFELLGSGELARGEALVVALYDEDREVFRFTFSDWTRQLSTALSPSAGWGVPMNAIEFSRSSAEPHSPVDIGLTLASTSVGRGFDSVGHGKGVYRNRIALDLR